MANTSWGGLSGALVWVLSVVSLPDDFSPTTKMWAFKEQKLHLHHGGSLEIRSELQFL
jgi:hypothetical protein